MECRKTFYPTLKQQILIINYHIVNRGHTAEDFAEWHDTTGTRRIARLFGVKRHNRKKVGLWKDILKAYQLIDKNE